MSVQHRAAVWIVPPVLAALAVPWIAGLAGATPAPDPIAPVGWADPAVLADCEDAIRPGSAVPPGTVGQSPPVAGGAWRLQPSLDGDGSLHGWRLLIGSAGTRAAAMDLPPASFVTGPVDGRLVIAADDGRRSTISTVAPGGCVSRIRDWPDVIRQAVPVPGSASIIFHSVSRADRTDLGVWQFTPAAAAAPVRIVAPVATEGDVARSVGMVWSTSLRVDAAGRTLAVESCGESTCRTRVVDLSGGPVRTLGSDSDGRVVGLGDGWLVGFSACAGMPCRLTATDLADGRQRVLAASAWSATTITRDGHLAVLAVVATHDGPALQLIDPAAGHVVRLAAGDPSLALLPEGGAPGVGLAAGPGRVAAVRLSDGLPVTITVDRLSARVMEATR